MSGIIAQNTLDNTGLIKAPEGGGAWTFIKKLTASSDSTLSFVNGASDVVLDSTYAEYIFYYVNMHPSTNAKFQFNMSIDTGSNYNVTKTSACHLAYHAEGDGWAGSGINAQQDLAQSTAFQTIASTTMADADGSCSGYLHLFGLSSTTFVKQFMSESNRMDDVTSNHMFIGGYGNTTSAVDAIQFKFHTGDMDSGDIFLHGLTI